MVTLQELITEDDRRVTVSHAREYFHGCIPNWQIFAAAYGFDWKTTVKQGLLASELLKTEDALAIQLLNYVYKDKLEQ
jgi:hypothetical protein